MRLIDADALFKALGFAEPCSECDHALGCFCVDPTWNDVCGAFGDAPTIDAEPVRHGRWIISPKTQDGYCSKCKCDMPVMMDDWQYKSVATNYCPNCGAKMDASEGEAAEE